MRPEKKGVGRFVGMGRMPYWTSGLKRDLTQSRKGAKGINAPCRDSCGVPIPCPHPIPLIHLCASAALRELAFSSGDDNSRFPFAACKLPVMPHSTYESPLATRNASTQMLKLFSPAKKFGLWRRLWLELARCERELGLERISFDAIAQMEAKLDDIDFAGAASWEKRLRHDVMAHVHTYEEAAPAAKGVIHLGATSQYVVDNADLIIMREAMTLLATRLADAIDALGNFALLWKDLPTLGYTHFQPAQLTTVGKRATLWAQDLAIDLEELEYRISNLRFRGVKGTTGTQASFLSLFDGDHAKVDLLDRMITERFGFKESFNVTGQTYPRKVDAQIVSSLAGIAASVHKFCNDIRLLAGMKQIEEPFETEQVGSSAMAYKRNPMRCERATGLSRFVISLASSPPANRRRAVVRANAG